VGFEFSTPTSGNTTLVATNAAGSFTTADQTVRFYINKILYLG